MSIRLGLQLILTAWATCSVLGTDILRYDYQGGTRMESGQAGKNVSGSWSWIDASGKLRKIWYTADENGFHAFGDIVPTVDHGGTEVFANQVPDTSQINTNQLKNNITSIDAQNIVNETLPKIISGTQFTLLSKMRPPTSVKQRVTPVNINPQPVNIGEATFKVVKGLHTVNKNTETHIKMKNNMAKSLWKNMPKNNIATPNTSRVKPKPSKVEGAINLDKFLLPLYLAKNVTRTFRFNTTHDYVYYDYYDDVSTNVNNTKSSNSTFIELNTNSTIKQTLNTVTMPSTVTSSSTTPKPSSSTSKTKLKSNTKEKESDEVYDYEDYSYENDD